MKKSVLTVCLGFCVLLSERETFAVVNVDSKELRALAAEFAPKVNIFSAVWKVDKNAIFYGGTTRDYLYWILGELKGAETREELNKKIQAIRDLPFIDIRGIVGPESDVDVISEKKAILAPQEFAVRRLDIIPPDRLDPNSPMGKSELDQGHIAAEKIELSMAGIRTQERFGDGVEDLATGKLTMNPTEGEQFWNSHFAKDKINHPILLVIRYLRLRGLHWSKIHGRGRPDLKELMDFDPELKRYIWKIFHEAAEDPKFVEFLNTEKGNKWLTASVLKAFRSYTNPTATYMLFEAFGYNKLQRRFETKMPSINQFLFIADRKPDIIAKNLTKYEVQADHILIPFKTFVKDSKLLHGTKKEESFRAILFQNVIPSSLHNSGYVLSAGTGLYGLESQHVDYAVQRAGNTKDLVVEFQVSEDAKVIDISEGAGLALFEKWTKETKLGHDEFAEAFGADVLRYKWEPLQGVFIKAYVVKNSAVLIGRRGLTRNLMTTMEALELANRVRGPAEYDALEKILILNAFTAGEIADLKRRAIKHLILETSHWLKTVDDLEKLVSLRAPAIISEEQLSEALNLLPSERLNRIVEELIHDPGYLESKRPIAAQVWLLNSVLRRKPLTNRPDLASRLLLRLPTFSLDSYNGGPEFLEALFFESGLTAEERENLGDQLMTEKAPHRKWLLMRALFPGEKTPFSEKARDRWVERQFELNEGVFKEAQHNGIVVDRDLVGLFLRGFSDLPANYGSQSVPVSQMPDALYQKMGDWMEKLIAGRKGLELLLSMRLLQSGVKDQSGGVPWMHQARFQKWLEGLLPLLDDPQLPHKELLPLFGFGPKSIKPGNPDALTLGWLKKILGKPVPKDLISDLYEDIVKRNIVTPETTEFILDKYPDALGGFDRMIEYMEKNEPENAVYRWHVLARAADKNYIGSLTDIVPLISKWILLDPREQLLMGEIIKKWVYAEREDLVQFIEFFRINGFGTWELQMSAKQLLIQLSPGGKHLKEEMEWLLMDFVRLILNSEAVKADSLLISYLKDYHADLLTLVASENSKLLEKFGLESAVVLDSGSEVQRSLHELQKLDPMAALKCVAFLRRLQEHTKAVEDIKAPLPTKPGTP